MSLQSKVGFNRAYVSSSGSVRSGTSDWPAGMTLTGAEGGYTELRYGPVEGDDDVDDEDFDDEDEDDED